MASWNFVSQEQFATAGHNLKLKPCPFCRRVGTLNLHGYLRGLDEKCHPIVRARRIFCSDRCRRPGCGHTFSLFLSNILVGLRLGTSVALAFLAGILGGLSVEKAYYAVAAQHALSLSAFWRLWRRLKATQANLRTQLCLACPPPKGPHPTPLRETLAHFAASFPGAGENPLERLQAVAQKSLVWPMAFPNCRPRTLARPPPS